MIMDFEKCLQYFACPYCKGDLVFIRGNEGTYICRKCDKKYPIIDSIPRFIEVDKEILKKAKDHWENSPNFQYEAKSQLYSKEYYEEQDKWREMDVDPFSLHEYQFNKIQNKIILDIGCGSGWVIKSAAKNGAFPIGVDFTEKAVLSTWNALKAYNLEGLVLQADAQYLPLKSKVIERVYSIGVLHHIPDTVLGISEAYRVLKDNGTGFISLYGKLFFFNPILLPIATFFLRLLLKAPAVRDGIQHTKNYDEFYRYMDGHSNPIGRWYTNEELSDLFSEFRIISQSKSHFPLRYLKIGIFNIKNIMPRTIHKILERHFGMMRNYQLLKSDK
tara:strand:+ start:436 stop:1428 length:993 start_codon:yes stop_codon:yes gene_type:complete